MVCYYSKTLLQTWYNLSDYEVEDQVNDRISFSKFLGLSLEDNCPDHSLISRFRTEMTKRKVYDKLLKEINKQLVIHGILVKRGILLDASVLDALRKPKGKTEYDVVIDR
ncbi:MAG: transposase [Bacteroidales bacterium]|nr:transposase [Bacteroidales bacterium]MDD4704086.1 transposase [Bacteroidales bacterium]